MVRVLSLIENGSYRFDHRTRRTVCQDVEGSERCGLADKVLSWPHKAPDLLGIHEEFYPGQMDWSEANCASA